MEALEVRNLLAAPLGPYYPPRLTEAEPNDVLTQAQDLGTLGILPTRVAGTVGNSPAGAADVDWYQFEVAGPAHVTLTTRDGPAGSSLVSDLSLYEADPLEQLLTTSGPNLPPFGSPSGWHQVAGAEGSVPLERDLAPGTYYVAVSGAGNRYFSPLLADSGSDGSTGPYLLSLTAQALPPTTGPVVLGGDPAPGSAVDHSPVLIRVDLSAAPAFQTVHLNQGPNAAPLDPVNDPVPVDDSGNPLPVPASVWLTYNPTGNFGDGNDRPVLLAGGDVNLASSELRLLPAAPLAPGYYQLTLLGDSGQHAFVITDLNGNPLGADAGHPLGRDLTFAFQVSGVEGRTGAGAAADDTPATAHELGDVSHPVQVAGTIGDDPAFAAVPGADVDLYHFRVTGAGRYALDAEAFAGRIDSPLDVGLSLFELDPVDGHTLRLVDANDNTGNGTMGPDGFTAPLSTDAAVYAGLTAGDYYLAVSAGGNVPDPALGFAPGVNGIYDLNAGTPYGGTGNLTTGDYVLSVLVQPASGAPHVVAATPAEGSTLTGPPTHLLVRFDKPVLLQRLAYETYQASQLTPGLAPDALAAVFVRAADGTTYYPRLQSFDPATDTADFLLLDALPNGAYELHLAGANQLTDLAGNPLVGNDPSGDYVVHFTVAGLPRGTAGNPRLWSDLPPSPSPVQGGRKGKGDRPVVLGPLFRQELTGAGVLIQGTLNPAGSSPRAEEDYQVDLLQGGQAYVFSLSTAGLALEVDDASGNPVTLSSPGPGTYTASLDAGTYRVRVLDPTAGQDGAVSYQLRLTIQATSENPTPLTVGPEPTFRIQLVTAAPAPPLSGLSAPAGPPAPPTRLTLSVPPPTSTTTAALSAVNLPPPAGPTAGDSAGPAPSRGAGPADTPASVLLALTAGPVGGVTTANALLADQGEVARAPDRLLVRGPELVGRDRLLQVAVLTGIDGAGNADGAASPPAGPALARLEALVGDGTTQAMTSWRQLLDFVFAAPEGLAQPPVCPGAPAGPDAAAADLAPPAPVPVDPEAGLASDDEAGGREAEPLPPAAERAGGARLVAWCLVLAVVCLVPAAFVDPPAERKDP